MFNTCISKHIEKLDKSKGGGRYLRRGGLPRPNRGLLRVRVGKPLVRGGAWLDSAAGRLTAPSER
jgi:hypothetical protein